MKSFEEISLKIIQLIRYCLIITIPDENIPIDYLTRKKEEGNKITTLIINVKSKWLINQEQPNDKNSF